VFLIGKLRGSSTHDSSWVIPGIIKPENPRNSKKLSPGSIDAIFDVLKVLNACMFRPGRVAKYVELAVEEMPEVTYIRIGSRTAAYR